MEEGTTGSRLSAALASGPCTQRAAQWVASAQFNPLCVCAMGGRPCAPCVRVGYKLTLS